ncbi:MAG: UDP-N-acetylglucosamine 4,6-dehydratase (inverting) [Myxococcales bacterium]|nr:UDP-N-acetylglucosamine 4,6-dehydratase (inverting) [Myxococcales bacterium]
MRALDGKSVLITGGTGSLGKKLVGLLLAETKAKKVIVYSRDELKQFHMAQRDGIRGDARVRFFLGDVRDKDRLARAFEGVDLVIHAAALKQVPAAEYNPFEAVKTNVIGGQNVIDCAIDKGVARVIALSTDKAANPINLYGATKLCSDKLFIAGNSYAGPRQTRFAVVRYGNVVGSRGSVVPLFLKLRESGVLPITDERMTRFWITLDRAARFVLDCLCTMTGAELYVPKIPSTRIVDLAEAIAPGCKREIVGIRPGEKLHEVMLTEDDARSAIDVGDRYILLGPAEWRAAGRKVTGTPCPEGFRYASDTNSEWLTADEIRKMVASPDVQEAAESA